MYVCMYVCVFVDGCMNVSMHECMCIYMRHTLLLWFSFSRFTDRAPPQKAKATYPDL